MIKNGMIMYCKELADYVWYMYDKELADNV